MSLQNIDVIERPLDPKTFALKYFYGADKTFTAIKSFRRSFQNKTIEEDLDYYSHHYYVEENNEIQFTVRITRWIEKFPDIATVYPFSPTKKEIPHIATASLFLSQAGYARTLSYTKQVWVHEIAAGIRSDLILVIPRLENYYTRLGYRRLNSEALHHPRTGNICIPMALVCDSDLKGGYADVCGHVASGSLGKRLKERML